MTARVKRTCFLILIVFATVPFWKDILEFIAIKVFENQSLNVGATQYERAILRDLLRAFDAVTRKNNISYFLAKGALLGYARNGDLLPWDDDVDLAIEDDYYQQVRLALGNLTGYVAYLRSHRYKLMRFFSKTKFTRKLSKGTYNFPYLDIFFVIRPAGKDFLQYVYDPSETILLADVYPLQQGVFMGVPNVMLPHDVRRVIQARFGEDAMKICLLDHYSGRMQRATLMGWVRIECEKLQSLFKKVETEGKDFADSQKSKLQAFI